MTPGHLFVYGTLRGDLADLRPAAAQAAFARLAASAQPVGAASLPGVLLDLGWYPGLAPGAGRVAGEVWRLLTPARTLAALDDYEGEAYRRAAETAVMAGGRRLPVWAWRLKETRPGVPRIASGDYVHWMRARTKA